MPVCVLPVVDECLHNDVAWSANEQEELALWTRVKGISSIHDEDHVTIGHSLTMDIAKDLSIHEGTCNASIAHLDKEASEQDEVKSSLIDRCL